jgi:hypothetical protein
MLMMLRTLMATARDGSEQDFEVPRDRPPTHVQNFLESTLEILLAAASIGGAERLGLGYLSPVPNGNKQLLEDCYVKSRLH